MAQLQKLMVNISKYIKVLLHSASGHQGSRQAHQTGNQTKIWNFLFQQSWWHPIVIMLSHAATYLNIDGSIIVIDR